ncbi:MAG: hypothetical protein J7L71_00380 [Spirochaetaceae bacterium]|nr:hypothetical protein [Spirochaetaceae bacterium]
MNQTQVKDILLRLKEDVEEFTVIFSGKKSTKVDGLYKPAAREIILHNRNTEDQNAIIYTAIHEFAHHIHVTSSLIPISRRAHTKEFWAILHSLLNKAENLKIYSNKFKTEADFQSLTRDIKEKFILRNGEIMKDFGKLLLKAYNLCTKYDMSFDDYVDRELGLGRTNAKQIMGIYTENLNPEIGYENMKTLTRIPQGEARIKAEEAFLSGSSPDSVKSLFINPSPVSGDPVLRLQKEKLRIERSIVNFNKRLVEIENSLLRITKE